MKNNVANPYVTWIIDDRKGLDKFEKDLLKNETEKICRIIREYPTVYIHNWNNTDSYEVYVGETNDLIRRTKEHYDLADADPNSWQHAMKKNKKAKLYVVGHEHFNKSLTLDIENRLIQYMLGVEKVKYVHNLRGNPQNSYYPVDELDAIFHKIWGKLRSHNKELFPTESEIRDSAIFKASPLHKLTKEQIEARDLIISRVSEALRKNQKNQLIFIDGEAGTGKTVLNSNTFYELYCLAEEKGVNRKIHLLVNHDEQVTVYNQIAQKLGITRKYPTAVSKPTTFINNHKPEDPVDVVFVDEAHLLLTQGKQAYTGKNQLQDIIDRAKVTVVMFDENQILTTEQYWEAKQLVYYRDMAKKANNYFVLSKQLRMQADPETIDWIDSFTKGQKVKQMPKSSSQYKIRAFSNPRDLEKAIKIEAHQKGSALSRIIATYDWEYNNKRKPTAAKSKYWEVTIGDWHKPWNRELEKDLDNTEKHRIKNLAWAEQPQTLDEIGSTFTIQGFDLNYAGVILGNSVKYRNGKIVFDPGESRNHKAIINRTLSDGSKEKFGEILLQHEVRVLMTRGVSGLFIYACDPELRKALLEAQK